MTIHTLQASDFGLWDRVRIDCPASIKSNGEVCGVVRIAVHMPDVRHVLFLR